MAQESLIPDISYLFMEKLVATAKENYPRVKSYATRTEIAKGNITRQQLSWLDPISLSYIYSPNNTLNLVTPSLFSGYQVSLSLNVGTLLKTPFNIREAKEQAKIAQNDEDEYNIFLEAEVKRRYFVYVQQISLVKIYSKSLQDAQALLINIKNKFERGEATFDIYSEALLTVSSNTQAKIASEAALLTAKTSLEELLNKKLEEVK